MPGHVVVVHDRRLQGASPTGRLTVVHVSAHTPLSRLVQAVSNLALQYGGEIRLKIMAHGYEADGYGGYGIQLCQEDLTLATVNQLLPLRNQLSYYITIYSCAAAQVAPGHQGITGDGRMLCSEIARVTATGVFAADATQYYNDASGRTPIDFGRWEGNLLEFDARGTLVASQHAPQDRQYQPE